MTTIKDIATKANVSIATVSYALSNSSQVSKETREKILKISKEMNYKPSMFAKGLRANQTNTIGIIVEDITAFNTPATINGIGAYAEKNGYDIILNNLRLGHKAGDEVEQLTRHLHNVSDMVEKNLRRELDGIIYVGMHYRDVSKIVDIIDRPTVCIYCFSDHPMHHSVSLNNEMSAYDATQYLIDHGHSKIAILTGITDMLHCQSRLKGYLNALNKNDIMINPGYMKEGDWGYEAGYCLTKELLNSTTPPTAIFSMNDGMAIGAMNAAREMNIAIPDNLSIVGFDNQLFSFFQMPKLTTVSIPLDEMGKTAAKMLIDRLSGKQTEKQHIEITGRLIERQTVKAINKNSVVTHT